MCIYILADIDCRAGRRLADYGSDEVGVSSITFAEVALGAWRDERTDVNLFLRFFDQVPVIPFDRDAALCYAGLPFRRASYDRLIAAHALALNATLVTSNLRDFFDIPRLKLEDWMA